MDALEHYDFIAKDPYAIEGYPYQNCWWVFILFVAFVALLVWALSRRPDDDEDDLRL